MNRKWNIALIGTGETSRIFLDSETFQKKNFQIIKIFDKAPELIGKELDHLVISDMNNLEMEIDPEIVVLGIVTVSPPDVQSVIEWISEFQVLNPKLGTDNTFFTLYTGIVL